MLQNSQDARWDISATYMCMETGESRLPQGARDFLVLHSLTHSSESAASEVLSKTNSGSVWFPVCPDGWAEDLMCLLFPGGCFLQTSESSIMLYVFRSPGCSSWLPSCLQGTS